MVTPGVFMTLLLTSHWCVDHVGKWYLYSLAIWWYSILVFWYYYSYLMTFLVGEAYREETMCYWYYSPDPYDAVLCIIPSDVFLGKADDYSMMMGRHCVWRWKTIPSGVLRLTLPASIWPMTRNFNSDDIRRCGDDKLLWWPLFGRYLPPVVLKENYLTKPSIIVLQWWYFPMIVIP